MTSLGLVSPARRTANNTPRKSSSSKKQVPIREYYIPASASVQELKQATSRQYEEDNGPSPSSRHREVAHEATPRHQQQQHYTPQKSNSNRSVRQPSRNGDQQITQAQQPQPQPMQVQRARTTSVARRVVLRGPDSAKNVQATASPASARTPQDREYSTPEETSRSTLSQRSGNERREAPSPSLRHNRQPSTFRYEQEKPSNTTHATEIRQQTFRTRVNQLSTPQASHHRNASPSPSSPSSSSMNRQQAHLPSPSTASTDDLDSDFILQFARDNKLELGAEVAQSLVRGSTRRSGKSPLMQKHEIPQPQPPVSRQQQQQVVQNQRSQPQQQTPQRSPLLTPDMAVQTPQHHSQTSPKPPRPPKSSRRLSATPSPVTPAPPAPCPRNEPEPARAPEPVALQCRAEDQECAYASVFDDADEDEPEEFGAHPPVPVKSETYSRRTSMSSTRPSRDRRERSYSNSSRHQPKQAHNTPHPPVTPATPKIPAEHAKQAAETRNITPQQQASTSLVLDESPSEAKTLISQYDDHAREDYERNRRLSSLLKGLGIQTRAKSPEMDTPEELLEEDDHDEGEEEELWQPVPSNSNLAEFYDESDVDAGQEEDESVMLTGDSFQTALDEEGVEIWGHETLLQEAIHRNSNGSLGSGSISQDESQDYEDEESDGSQSDHDYDDDGDDKSWYEEDSHRSRHSLRRSYSDKPQPLPPEYTLDEVRRSIIEQRASLGITDSVLAGILATDSFCMPDGIRMSIEQIAARLSMDKLRASNGSFRRTRRTTSGHTNSSLPYTGRDRYLSVASSTELPLSATGRKSWEQEAFPPHLSDNAVEVLQEPEGGYAEEDLPPLPPHDAELPPPTSRSAGTPVDPTWRQSNLSMSEALALRPLPLELPSEDEASKPVENIPPRKRTRSVSAFQRLSSTFTGSSNKTKSRKRLPSFLSGFVGSNKGAATDASGKKTAASPTLLAPAKAAEDSPQSSLQPPSVRKRASTGPLRLVDIANEVTNTPDLANVVPPPASPSSPAESSRSKTMGQLPGSTETWRSSVPEHVYAALARTNSKNELRRQEVIYELYRTEESFVNGLKGVVRVFSQPLRTPQGRWIAGVPIPVARLLDWLDDIVYLHSQITSILADCRHSQGHVVHKLADALLDFLPRLEVHQPYLIRFEAVTKSIDDMVVRPDSDFGEFVRMQQALPECGAMPLSSFLLKPVQRLMKYPLFFKQLRDLTPAHHPDHEATQELLDMTDSMIKAMEGVKVREEEYESLKVFASKIVGLPTGLILAKRDRRLLGQGVIHRIEISDSERRVLEEAEDDIEPSYRHATSQPMSAAHKAAPLHSNSRKSIISDSAYGSSPRPMSYFSDAGSLAPSMSTGYSVASTNWEGSSTFSPPIPGSSSIHSRATSPSIHSTSASRSANAGPSMLSPHSHAPPLSSTNHCASHGRQKSTCPSPPTAAPSSLRGILKSSSAIAMNKHAKASRDQPLHVLIFNDLVLFTVATAQHGVTAGVRGLGLKPSKSSLKLHPSSTNLQALQKDDQTRYTVVDDWGVAKLIGVTDLSGRTEHENLYKLDLLPLWSEADERRPFTLRTAAICTTIYISLPDPASAPPTSMLSHRRTPSTSTMQRNVNGRPVEHAMLLEAIDRSYIHSLQNIAFSATVQDETSSASRRGSIAVRKLQRGIQGLHEAIKQTSLASIPRSPPQQRFNATSTVDPSTDIPRSPTSYNDPHSPSVSSAVFDASSHRPDDLAEREERQFWSYRYKKIKFDLSKEGGIEAQIEEILQSGLLHCSKEEIEAIIENLNGGENDDLIPDSLINSLRSIKQNEEKLRFVLREAKKGVRMIPASNSSVGLAISYPASASSPRSNSEDRSYRTSEESQHYSTEEGSLQEDEDDGYQEPHRQEIPRRHGTRIDNSSYLRVDDMRYREQQQYDDEDEEEEELQEEKQHTDMSESEYESGDQEYLDYDEDEENSPPRRGYNRGSEVAREQYSNPPVRAASAVKAQLSPRAQQSPRIQVHSSPRTQPSPRVRQSPRVQQQSPKLQSTPRLQQSPRAFAKASPRIQHSTPTAASTGLTSSTMQRESSLKQQRYGAYYRPAGTSSPASMTTSSPRINTPSAPSSTILHPKSPSMTPSRTSPNHLALASQMRRERQASSHHSSPNLNQAAGAASAASPVGGGGGRRRTAVAPGRDGMSASPQVVAKEREIQPSPSLETVFTVQRAQRVPLTRRI